MGMLPKALPLQQFPYVKGRLNCFKFKYGADIAHHIYVTCGEGHRK